MLINELYGLQWKHQEEKVQEALYVPIKAIEPNAAIQHRLFEGDNLESMLYIEKEQQEKFDIIYIDPPYNTGRQFKYNDNFTERGDRHSKWLSFMYPRLQAAQRILKEDGIIYISIDENEFAQLKLLCDLIFGEENYIGNIIWDKRNPKGSTKTLSSRKEYILTYGKNKESIKEMLVKKDNAQTIISKGKSIFKKKTDLEAKNKEFRDWLRVQPFSPGEKMYSKLDEKGRPYRDVHLDDPSGKGPTYEVYHPVTNKPCKQPKGGWRLKEEKMEDLLNRGYIMFGKDETTMPQRKYLLEENMKSPLQDILQYPANGILDLHKLGFPKDIFENPKPVGLIKKLLEVSPKDAKVLDFFGGSGTTAHAVIELNQEEGSERVVNICTNNENGICETICSPRIVKVLEKENNESFTQGLLHYKRHEN